MSKPPIKAMEAVKRYCKKREDCEGCPLHSFDEYGCCLCFFPPEYWKIERGGDSDA